jgi:nucleotide-binding universal stress UspA family protein
MTAATESPKIIIGHDGTDRGEDALALGALMAPLLDATPVVATVLTWPAHLMGADDLTVAAEMETAELFARVKDRFSRVEPETRRIVERAPAKALHELAEAERALLIVVGSTHRGPIGRVTPGSVGTALLQNAPCAVMVAPNGYASKPERRAHRLAVAFDGSTEAWAALETAFSLTARVHGSLTVLTVAELPRYGRAAALAAGDYRFLEREDKKRLLDRALKSAPDGIAVHGDLNEGDPASVLADASDGFDLIVMGSRGYGPARRALVGSVSARVARLARCATLLIPRAAGPDPLGLGGQPVVHRSAITEES